MFSATTSPSVATYGLRQSVADHPDHEIRELVRRNFYVDDLLVSVPLEKQAVSLIRKTQEALMEGGKLRLHKVASNSHEVMSAFDDEDAENYLYKDFQSPCPGVTRNKAPNRSDYFPFCLR